jgi:outer membrane protein W
MKFNLFSCVPSLLLSLFLLNGYQSANAQNKTWGAGPELGISLSKMVGDMAQDQKYNSGLMGGGHVTYSTRNTFGITFKALYHRRGSKEETNGIEYHNALDYLEFPLIARYFLTPGGKFRPNVFAGPSAALLLSVKNKTGDGDYTNVSSQMRNTYRNFDLGLTAGIGLNYLIGKETRLLFDARYLYGLSDINSIDRVSMQNRSIAFTLGLSFGLTKQPLK